MNKTSVKLKFRAPNATKQKGTLFIQIIRNRIARQISTDYHIYPHEWDASRSIIINGKGYKRNHQLSLLRHQLSCDIDRINRIICSLTHKGLPFEASDIIAEHIRCKQEHSLFNFTNGIIIHLTIMGKNRTAEIYRTVLNSFIRYRKGKDLMIDSITSDEIKLYESHMQTRGICPNTVSFYLRTLRAIYNRAVDHGITEQRNPFCKVFTGICKTRKRAISLALIKQIKQLDLSKNHNLQLARDIFLFSFYTRGMAFIDIVNLKKNNLKHGIITYRRQKTGQELHVKVEKCAQEIIDRYHNPNNTHLLPIIKNHGNKYIQYRRGLQLTNRYLKEIGKMINAPVTLTTYVGRHSWGTAARINNIPLPVISEAMGHNNERTTAIYLASIDCSMIDDANALILNKI